MKSPREHTGVLVRLWLPAVSLLALAACSDGYPADDSAESDPSGMSQERLIEALDRVGSKPHIAQRMRYALEPGCQLVISARMTTRVDQRIKMEGSTIEALSVDGDINIRVTPKDKTSADAVTVLVTTKWTDSAWVRSLLAHLRRSCELAAPPAA